MKFIFGKLGSPGSEGGCKRVIGIVFVSHHVIGFAINDPSVAVLAIMVAPLMGKPGFVVRPMYSLKADFLFEQVNIAIRLIHESSAFVYLVMSDETILKRIKVPL